MSRTSAIVKFIRRRWGVTLIVLFVAMQIIPFGHDHPNPPVTSEPKWDSPQTRALADRACFGCHSNETTWPWYSRVAPVSWLVQRDVLNGRRHLNFSEWDRTQRHARDTVEQVRTGEMPPWFYLPLHPEASLTPSEKDQLMRGFTATLAAR